MAPSFAPGQVRLDVRVGERRYVLPTFIAEEKQPAAPGAQSGIVGAVRPVVVAVRSNVTSSTSWSLATVVPGNAVTPAVLRSTSLRVLPARDFFGYFDSLPDASPRDPQSGAGSSGGKQSIIPGTGPLRSAVSYQYVVLDNLSTDMSDVITSAQLRTLPLYNRNFLALGLLSASTFNVPAGSDLQGATFGVSGQRPTSNDFLMDGMDNVASGNNQAIPFQVNDAIQEFRVVYATPEAQYGRSTGGVVERCDPARYQQVSWEPVWLLRV